MNLDIQTEHVLMQPEWHRTIDAWIARCATDVAAVDVTLRHAEEPHAGNQVDAVARSGGRTLRVGARGAHMADVLHDALDALERELVTIREQRDRRKAA